MYFITMIDSKNDNTRCVGYYNDWNVAVAAVLNNVFDINETCYDYCVIENVPEGCYMYDCAPRWFKYDRETNKYIEILEVEIPDKYYNDVGFAIG